MREWTDEQRRNRLVLRQLVSHDLRVDRVEAIAERLVAIHSSDPATVYLSIAARLLSANPVAEIDRALYEDRTLMRLHGMRQTLFVVPQELAQPVFATTAARYAAKQRESTLRDLQTNEPLIDMTWLELAEEKVLTWLSTAGEATGSAISAAVPELRTAFTYGRGTASETTQNVSSRLLRNLGYAYRIVRGKPVGSWVSSQYRWSVAPESPPIDVQAARTLLLERWLRTHGPALMEDIRWWFGWTVKDIRLALETLQTEQVQLSCGEGIVLVEDAEPDEPRAHGIALLPALDSTPMGFRNREFFFTSEHAKVLFDRSGNIGPTIWWDGRIVGGWAQTRDGRIATRWLEPVSAEAELACTEEAERMQNWIGEIRVTPRFRTPLERELVASDNS